ncbi:MAG: ABC transporter permease subunit [Ferruginibacter sp.]
MKNILQYEWKLFLRSKLMVSAWVLMFVIGLYALYYGKSFTQTQATSIYTMDTAYQGRVQKQIQSFSADTTTKEGKAAYNNAVDPFMSEWLTHYMLWKKPTELQTLSIGQSDNQPFYYYIGSYYDNVYTNKQIELRNPQKLLAGNFDLAFVLTYLLPLLIIAFCYSLVSNDKEAGISTILNAQGISLQRLLNGRILFRLLLVISLFMLLSSIGFIMNGIHSFSNISAWLLIGSSYLLFWFALAYAIVSLRKNSVITALILVSSWIFFLLLMPSLISNTSQANDAERIEISDADREYSQYLWDYWQSKTTALIDTFYTVVPQWKKYGIKDTNEVNSVAYSYLDIAYMNTTGWKEDSAILEQQHNLDRYKCFNPAYTVQNAINLLAGTESNQFTLFRKAAADYHLERTAYLSEIRLKGKPLTIAGYKGYPLFNQPAYSFNARKVLQWIWTLWLLTILLYASGLLLHKKIIH